MKKRNTLINFCVTFIAILSIVFTLVACDNSSQLKYSINEDGETCTITGVGLTIGADLIIPEEIDGYSVVAIADNAFMNCDFKTVSLSESITQIGKSAFEGCSLLESINIPQNVTAIQERTFYGCTNFKAIKFPEGLTDVKDFAFYGCSGLTSVEFPSTLINIGQGAFFYCKLLSEIYFPEGLKKIDGFGFGYCNSIIEVYIPSSVEKMSGAFANCESLERIDVDSNNKSFISVNGVLYDSNFRILIQYPGGKTESSFAVQNNVKYIETWAFSGNYHLKSIDVPSSVKLINVKFLMNCPYVNTINYDGTVLKWDSIQKREGWDSYWQEYDYDYTIYCTDGTISQDGTVTYK